MNARTPYWPLFRNELGIDYYPKIPWALGLGFCLAIWLAASFVPLLLLFKSSGGDLINFFVAFGELTGFALIWWLMITGWLFAFALLPGISNPVQSVRAFEFMFTRAIDRRRLFRIRSAVIYLVLLGPLLLNMVLSASLSKSADVLFYMDSAYPRWDHHVGSFPASNTLEEELLKQPGLTLIHHGEVVLTGWVFCLGTLGLLFMQGYCVLLARRVQHNPWLAGIAIGAPVLAAFFFAPWIPRHYPHLYEESFLFFARNWVPLLIGLMCLMPMFQIFSERRFSKLEIL